MIPLLLSFSPVLISLSTSPNFSLASGLDRQVVLGLDWNSVAYSEILFKASFPALHFMWQFHSYLIPTFCYVLTSHPKFSCVS